MFDSKNDCTDPGATWYRCWLWWMQHGVGNTQILS